MSDTAFRLSRLYAEGWNVANKLSSEESSDFDASEDGGAQSLSRRSRAREMERRLSRLHEKKHERVSGIRRQVRINRSRALARACISADLLAISMKVAF
jgi:hypothetical protein